MKGMCARAIVLTLIENGEQLISSEEYAAILSYPVILCNKLSDYPVLIHQTIDLKAEIRASLVLTR